MRVRCDTLRRAVGVVRLAVDDLGHIDRLAVLNKALRMELDAGGHPAPALKFLRPPALPH